MPGLGTGVTKACHTVGNEFVVMIWLTRYVRVVYMYGHRSLYICVGICSFPPFLLFCSFNTVFMTEVSVTGSNLKTVIFNNKDCSATGELIGEF